MTEAPIETTEDVPEAPPVSPVCTRCILTRQVHGLRSVPHPCKCYRTCPDRLAETEAVPCTL